MDGSTVLWNSCKKANWGEVLYILVPILFATLFGVLLAYFLGALTIYLFFELIASYA